MSARDRMSWLRFWLLGLCLCSWACSQAESRGTATQVMVEIDAEEAVAAEAASLRVRVEGGDGVDALRGRVSRLDELVTPIEFPKRVALVPLDKDVRRAFVLTATVYDAAGEFVAEARLISGYVPGEVRFARLLIQGSGCLRKQCEDDRQTCSQGSCVSAQVDVEALSSDSDKPTTLTFGESDAGELADAGVVEDAGADASTRMDANTAVDAAPDTDAASMDAALANEGGANEGGTSESGTSESGTSDAGPNDASRDADAREAGAEAGPVDAGSDAADAAPDAGQPTCDATKAPDLSKLGLTTVASGFSDLVYAAQAPNNDWYFLQQGGALIVRPAAGGANIPLLNLSAEIGPADNAGERGLLGMAFAPDFATSGNFYVMLTPTTGPTADSDTVRLYQRQGSTAVLRDTLLTLPQSASNHNGGTLQFGPDGMLYVGTGDGGGGCNPPAPGGSAQQISADPDTQHGKILRLDPARKAQGFAAVGNPFAASPLVYHYGLRNPFRFSFDRATGDLYIGDVGQNQYEEVDFAKAGSKGLNFGWAAFEANAMTCAGQTLNSTAPHTPPVFVAPRPSGCTGQFCDWLSVIGGVVYRGSAIPKLRGVYLAGDYYGARMAAFTQCDATTSPISVIRKEVDPNQPNAAAFQGDIPFNELTAIVEDRAGEIYFVANRTELLKVVPVP